MKLFVREGLRASAPRPVERLHLGPRAGDPVFLAAHRAVADELRSRAADAVPDVPASCESTKACPALLVGSWRKVVRGLRGAGRE